MSQQLTTTSQGELFDRLVAERFSTGAADAIRALDAATGQLFEMLASGHVAVGAVPAWAEGLLQTAARLEASAWREPLRLLTEDVAAAALGALRLHDPARATLLSDVLRRIGDLAGTAELAESCTIQTLAATTESAAVPGGMSRRDARAALRRVGL